MRYKDFQSWDGTGAMRHPNLRMNRGMGCLNAYGVPEPWTDQGWDNSPRTNPLY